VNRKQTFRKLDLFPSSGEEGRHLGKSNLVGIFPPHLTTETDPVSETSCFLVSRIPDDGKGKTPVILTIIRYYYFRIGRDVEGNIFLFVLRYSL
jgi:hypothetical protein